MCRGTATHAVVSGSLEGKSLSRMQSEAPSDLPIRQDCKAAEPRRAVVLPTARIPADPG